MKYQIITLLLATTVLTHATVEIVDRPLGNNLPQCLQYLRAVIADLDRVAANHKDTKEIVKAGNDCNSATELCGPLTQTSHSAACKAALEAFIAVSRKDAQKLISHPAQAIKEAQLLRSRAERAVGSC